VLQPGDELSLTLLGVQTSPHVAVVGINGQVSFPFVGVFNAEGLTLDALRRELEEAAAGIEVPSPNGNSQAFNILDARSIFLEISEFRPVTIIGQVSQPGAVAFAPGMTVRAAIGAAGGIDTLQGNPMTALEAPAQLRAATDIRRLLLADMLKNEILLGEPASLDEVSEDDLALLSEYLGPDDVANAIEEIELAITERHRRREALNARVDLVSQRIDTLRAAFENYSEASSAEEERLARMLEMSDRGLATADMVNNTRLAALNASTRLLTIESDIFQTRAERERLPEEIENLQDEYRVDLFTQNTALTSQITEITGRIEGLQALILGRGGAIASAAEPIVETFIYRGFGENEEMRPASLGERVQPGDVIEVRVQLDDG
jgi:polysaccharide export outer membrane protein